MLRAMDIFAGKWGGGCRSAAVAEQLPHPSTTGDKDDTKYRHPRGSGRGLERVRREFQI